MEIIKTLANKYLSRIQNYRREIHRYPELAHEEFKTQALIQEVLDEAGIENQVLASTGVVGLIKGKYPGKTVLLRADMDALPIEEKVDVEFRSTLEGKMHACGHDGHTAGLLGAALILNDLKNEIHGNIKLMFQPAEETDGGALPMIEEGILKKPKVDAAFGLHLAGNLPFGKIGIRYGSMYGSPDEFEIEIKGRGGHAASPHETIDPISLAVQYISTIQYLVTRQIDPVKPAVISFTSIHAGKGLNVIPELAYLGGTIRTLDLQSRDFIAKVMEATLENLCSLNDSSFTFKYLPSYPPLINDDAMTDLLKATFNDFFKEDAVIEVKDPSLGAEDFAYLAQHVPASYYLVGIAESDKPEPIHHHPEFSWDDRVLEITSASLAKIAMEYLKS